MKRVLTITVCIFVLIMFTSGCGMAKSIGKAEEITTAYYTAMQQEDYDAALLLYGDRFFEQTDRDSWKESLEAITKRLGSLDEYKLKNWGVNEQRHLLYFDLRGQVFQVSRCREAYAVSERQG